MTRIVIVLTTSDLIRSVHPTQYDKLTIHDFRVTPEQWRRSELIVFADRSKRVILKSRYISVIVDNQIQLTDDK